MTLTKGCKVNISSEILKFCIFNKFIPESVLSSLPFVVDTVDGFNATLVGVPNLVFNTEDDELLLIEISDNLTKEQVSDSLDELMQMIEDHEVKHAFELFITSPVLTKYNELDDKFQALVTKFKDFLKD